MSLPCPCGLTQEKLDEKGWLDNNQECTARYRDANGAVQVCGRLYTEHPHTLAGISTLTAAPPPPASISTLPPQPANSDDLDLQSLLRKFVPCGLTYEYLVSKNRVDDEDKCTAKWADGSGNVCNRPLGAHHPYAPPAPSVQTDDYSRQTFELLQQYLLRTQPLSNSSPHQTPTTVGDQAMENSETFSPIQGKPSMLTAEELDTIKVKLQSNQSRKGPGKMVGEHLFVRLLTPRLQETFDLRNLRVVNSEDLPWLNSMGANLKPDLFLCPSWVYTRRFKSKAAQHDQLCGTVPVKKLYDSVYLVDAKLDSTQSALGDLVMHLSNLSSHCKGMLITINDFYLVSWEDSHVVKCVTGKWTDHGSKDLIVEFFPPMKWDITSFLAGIGVAVDEPQTEHDSAFLGAGAYGRVIRVRDLNSKKSVGGEFMGTVTPRTAEDCQLKAGDIEVSVEGSVNCSIPRDAASLNRYALKILYRNPSQLTTEYNILHGHLNCGCDLIMKPVPDSIFVTDDFSGMLLSSIGSPVKLSNRNTSDEILQILSTLWRLHTHTPPYIHGDPRLENLLICDGKYVWIDLLNGQVISDAQKTLILFQKDLTTLVDSLLQYNLQQYPSFSNFLNTYDPFSETVQVLLQEIAEMIHLRLSSPVDALSNLKIGY